MSEMFLARCDVLKSCRASNGFSQPLWVGRCLGVFGIEYAGEGEFG